MLKEEQTVRSLILQIDIKRIEIEEIWNLIRPVICKYGCKIATLIIPHFHSNFIIN